MAQNLARQNNEFQISGLHFFKRNIYKTNQ